MSSNTTTSIRQPTIAARAVLPRVFHLSVPTMAEGLLSTIIPACDALMLAQLPRNEVYLAAAALTGIWMWRLVSMSGATMVGTGAFVARRWGERNYTGAGRASSHGMVLGLIIGALVAAAIWPLVPAMFSFLTSDAVTREISVSYFRIFLIALAIRLATLNMTAAMRAAGDTRTPLLIMIVMIVANIGFNWLLIYGNLGFPRLLMDGAAFATVMAFGVGFIISAWMLHRGVVPRRLMQSNEGEPIVFDADMESEGETFAIVPVPASQGAERLAFDRAGIKPWLPGTTQPILKVSYSAFWEEVLVSIGFLTFMAMVGSFGVAVLAAHSAVVRIEALSFTAGYGVAVAAATLVGQALGARQVRLARRMFTLTTIVSMGVMALIGVLFMIFHAPLLAMFRLDPSVLDIAVVLIFIVGFEQSFIASAMTLSGGLRGAGDTFSPFVVQLIGTIGMRIGGGYLMAFTLGMGVTGLYWATALDWLVRSLVLAWFVRRGRWERISV